MNRVLIIAEAGVNHNGNLKTAQKLALAAKEAGADIVKFQTAKLDSLVSKHAEMAEYQKKNVGTTLSQKEMLRKLLLTYEDFVILADYCKSIGIDFLSTPFDIDSIQFLRKLECVQWKVPSGEITNYPYLLKIAETGLPVILSTGMSTMDEIREALDVLEKNDAGKVTLLHCTTAYPAAYKDVNLRAMVSMMNEFGLKVGYSDHTEGIEIPIAAVAMGACIIEKHFTLDKNMDGPDHKASLEPCELKEMVDAIRNIEVAMGNGIKTPTQVEEKNRVAARKSIVARTSIKKGEVFTEKNITTKRPGNGISPMNWNNLIGKTAIRDFDEDELIEI